MPRSGTRRRIGEDLYEDASGWSAIARAAGKRREKRFAPGTPKREIAKWLDDTRRELRKAAGRRDRLAPPGSLGEAVHRYLIPFPEGSAAHRDTRNLLLHWVTAIGHDTPLTDITFAHLKSAVVVWRANGNASSTINHRRRALVALFDTFDPERNPARQLPRESGGDTQIRALPIDLAERIIDAMPDIGRPVKGQRRHSLDKSKTKARLRVMLWTGLPQATLMRVRVDDVDLDRRRVHIRARRKGAGAAATDLPLTTEGVEAFRAFLRASAWGTFSTKSMAQSFHRAIDKLLKADPSLPIPRDWRPYDLRHTWLSYVLEVTGDSAAVSQLGQHADPRSTRRYVRRAELIRAELAIEAIRARRTVAPDGGTNPDKDRK